MHERCVIILTPLNGVYCLQSISSVIQWREVRQIRFVHVTLAGFSVRRRPGRTAVRGTRRKLIQGGIGAALVTGVGGSNSSSDAFAATHMPSSSGFKMKQGEDTQRLIVALGSEAITLAPNIAADSTTDWQLQNIFDPLLRRDADNGYKIGSWLGSLSPIDDLNWEFKLVSDDIQFHNGELLTSEAIKATLEFVRNDANKSAIKNRWESIGECEIVDELTVTFTTPEPYPSLPLRLCEFLVMPPAYLAESDLQAITENPIGTGPFKLQSWARGERLVLEKNPSYWHGESGIMELEFRYIPDASARLASMLAGEVDVLKDVPVDAVDIFSESSDVRLEELVSQRLNFVALVNNREGSVFENEKLRQAVNYGVNVDAIIGGIYQGHATRAPGVLSPESPDLSPEASVYPYDLDKAKSLVADASSELGIDLSSHEIILDSPQGRYPMDSDATQAIAAECQMMGLNVQVRYNEWGSYLEDIRNKQTGDMFYLSVAALDARYAIPIQFGESAVYSGYSDPELEELVAEASSEMDEQEAEELWNECQKMINERAAWLFLYVQHDLYGVSNRTDWKPRLDEMIWMGSSSIID